MRDIRVYTSQPLAIGQEVFLDTTASRHLITVLRLRSGDQITLFNGQGGEFSGLLTECNAKKASVAITEYSAINRESPLNIHLGIGLSRGDRMDWVVQKATEAGVSQITPLYTEHTEIKLKGERIDKKMRHWQQISISACEQSYRTQLPELHVPTSLEAWVNDIQADKKLVLHHRSQQTLRELRHQTASSIALLIGPEGGLSTREINLAEEVQSTPLTIGPRVLRTETAPVIVIGILQSLWGDYQ